MSLLVLTLWIWLLLHYQWYSLIILTCLYLCVRIFAHMFAREEEDLPEWKMNLWFGLMLAIGLAGVAAWSQLLIK